jgi:hypothetical protein
MLLGFNQVTSHTSAPWNQPSHRPPKCSLDSAKSPATPVLLGINQVTGHPSAPWIQPSYRPPQCSLESTKSPAIPVLFGINQVTGHPSAPWIQPNHRPPQYSLESTKSPATPMLFGINQVTGSPNATLDSSKPPVHPSAPLDYPSHRFIPVGVVLLHCTRLQCSLHFCTYTLTMQSMVSAFIQHPSKHPSRYIITGIRWCILRVLLKNHVAFL